MREGHWYVYHVRTDVPHAPVTDIWQFEQARGFFEESGFYPDFILWIKKGENQRVVFIEPHGMLNAPTYAQDQKAQLHEKLPELARAISERSGISNVSLDSFIVSAIPYEELCKRYDGWNLRCFASKHILFPERDGEYDYVAEIIEG